MVKTTNYKKKYGINYTEWKALRARIMFKQGYKCAGCGEPIGIHNGDKHMHHVDGNPRHTFEANLMILCPLDHWFANGFDLKIYRAKPTKFITLERFFSSSKTKGAIK